MAAPGGVVVATLPKGTRITRGTVRNGFTELPLEGWVFGASTAPSNREGFDIAVTPSGGENLRDKPNGDVVARLRSGAGFKKVGTRGAWVQVRRTVWINMKALTPDTPPPAPPAVAASAKPESPAPARSTSRTDSSIPSGAGTATASTPLDSLTGRARASRESGLFLAPEKGRIGSLVTGATVEPLGRARGWVRVRVEAWVRESDLEGQTASSGPVITAADLRTSPAKFEGASVDWRVQFVSVRVADELRPELPLGQSYALVRGPLPEPGFVYVALSDAQAAQFRKLTPLAELSIRGRIMVGRTRYTGTPVVELERITEGG